AQQMCTKLLSLPEVSESPEAVHIATEKIKNSTRYMIDTDLLLRRLRLDLNKYSQGQLRFFAQGSGQRTRTRILREREQTQVQEALDDVARYIAESDLVQNSQTPVRLDVKPVANTNLFNMNADSFASLLRTKIKDQAGSKVLFARPGSDAEVDYTLTGEFFVESIQREGVANTVEDLKWAQEHPNEWYEDPNESRGSTVYGTQINLDGSIRRRIKIGPNITYKLIDASLWNSPNLTKKFNVMIVNNENMAVLERVVSLEEQITSGQERANYILTGDISSLSKAGAGQRSDYVLVSLYLIEPTSNEIICEYGYEVKRVTSRSVLYR
ncbi:MAG: hypothetical protein JXM79_17135, partial [Sedimentisphaerales bacterium]|nr:hypothetical protein [Sedimentisphaerales bacterium]